MDTHIECSTLLLYMLQHSLNGSYTSNFNIPNFYIYELNLFQQAVIMK